MLRLCAEQAADAASSARHRSAEIAKQLKKLRAGIGPDQASLDQAMRSARDARFLVALAHRTATLVHYEAAMTSAIAARRLESRDQFIPAIRRWQRAEDLETSAFAEFNVVSPATDPYAEDSSA